MYYLIATLIIGFSIGYLYNSPKYVFDPKTKEIYFIHKGKRYFVTRSRIGIKYRIFFNEEEKQTHLGYVYGLQNIADKSSQLRLSSIDGDAFIAINPKENIIEKLENLTRKR